MSGKQEAVTKVAASATAQTKKGVQNKNDNTTKEGKKKECVWWPDAKPQIDWTGRQEGYLTFLQPVLKKHNGSGGFWFYLCLCECKQETIVSARKSDSLSCGCHSKDAATAYYARKKQEKKTEATEASRQAPRSGATRPKGALKALGCFYKGYACDKLAGRNPGGGSADCYGNNCYVNAHLAIGA